MSVVWKSEEEVLSGRDYPCLIYGLISDLKIIMIVENRSSQFRRFMLRVIQVAH